MTLRERVHGWCTRRSVWLAACAAFVLCCCSLAVSTVSGTGAIVPRYWNAQNLTLQLQQLAHGVLQESEQVTAARAISRNPIQIMDLRRTTRHRRRITRHSRL